MARTNKSRAPALAYLRTSSAANVGTDRDCEKRQRHAVQGFARRAGYGIVDEFYDAAVSGAEPIETRAGFAALLDRIESNGVRTVIVEDASRFARELMAQELGITLLISRGVRLLTASGDDLTASDDPTRKMMRQIAWWRAAASCHGWASACSADMAPHRHRRVRLRVLGPLTPLILFAASPGTITGVITLSAAHSRLDLPITALVAVVVASAVTWLVLLLMGRVADREGGAGFARATMTSFMGLIVLAMGVQFALTGLRQFGP